MSVSIIIPYFNSSDTLLDTLCSCLASTIDDFEIIIVNDGSCETMNPIQIINKIDTDIISYINLPSNRGVSYARNIGALHSKKKYLLFLDSDDLIEATYLEKALVIFEKFNHLKLVYCKSLFLTGKITKKWHLKKPTKKNMLITNRLPISCLIKKSDFNAINGFDESLECYEDWDFWLRLIKSRNQVYRINEVLFFYRIGHSNINLSSVYYKNKQKDKYWRNIIYSRYKSQYRPIFGLSQFQIYIGERYLDSLVKYSPHILIFIILAYIVFSKYF
jgi:glycosyltransferase involved in cell wall biosynthesis